jgi:hypothetical protein
LPKKSSAYGGEPKTPRIWAFLAKPFRTAFRFFSKSLCGAKNKESDSLIRKRPDGWDVDVHFGSVYKNNRWWMSLDFAASHFQVSHRALQPCLYSSEFSRVLPCLVVVVGRTPGARLLCVSGKWTWCCSCSKLLCLWLGIVLCVNKGPITCFSVNPRDFPKPIIDSSIALIAYLLEELGGPQLTPSHSMRIAGSCPSGPI